MGDLYFYTQTSGQTRVSFSVAYSLSRLILTFVSGSGKEYKKGGPSETNEKQDCFFPQLSCVLNTIPRCQESRFSFILFCSVGCSPLQRPILDTLNTDVAFSFEK